MKELVYAVNNAIATSLGLPFENIHNESIEEGLVVPAAFVFVEHVERYDMLGDKSQQRIHFDIAYLDDTSNRAELLDIIDKMHRGLFLLEMPDGSLKRANKGIEWDIGDDAVVHGKAAYNITTDIAVDTEKVETMTQDRSITKE